MLMAARFLGITASRHGQGRRASGAKRACGRSGRARGLPSISLVDRVERACCAQPVIGWAGMGMSGIARLAAGIEAELAWRLPRQRKTQRGKLALLVATMLSERSANLMDLAAALPR